MPRIVKKPEERRKEIILASRDLFLSKGYDNTTMQDIMAKLLIAKGTTYYYFKSKEEILEAVVDHMLDDYLLSIRSSLDKCHGNAIDKLHALIKAGRNAAPSSETLESLHRTNNREMHARLLAATVSRLAPLYAEVIAQGCQEGIFRTSTPLECAEFLIAGSQFITDIGCHPWTPQDLDRRINALPGLLENLLRAPKGAFDHLIKP